MDLVPAILKNALTDFQFQRPPLWRLAEGQELVKVELTFLKPSKNNQPTAADRKKRAASRNRKPAPSANEWPRQPRPARQPAEVLRETPPPTETTLPVEPPATVIRLVQTPATTIDGGPMEELPTPSTTTMKSQASPPKKKHKKNKKKKPE